MAKVIIIDFGASLMHTHHSRVIRGFAEMLDNMHEDFSLLLPLGSEIDIKFSNNSLGKLSRQLIPSYHPVSFQINKLSSYIPALFNKIYRHSNEKIFQLNISRLLSRLISLHTYYILRRQTGNFNEALTIVFPTTCPIAFKLGLLLEKKGKRCKIVYRLTNTAEIRGFHTVSMPRDNAIKSLLEAENLDLRFGFEMKEYRQTLSIPENLCFPSPTPCCKENPRSIVKALPTLGFLGMAQRHKGVNWLSKLITEVEELNTNSGISWLIQTEPSVPKELLLLAAKYDINFLPGKLTEAEMTNAFQNVDLICLPYNVESYLENASALAYRAADNLVAVATLSGSAFAREIAEYQIGTSSNNIKNLAANVVEMLSQMTSYREKILSYNEYRNQCTMNILE